MRRRCDTEYYFDVGVLRWLAYDDYVADPCHPEWIDYWVDCRKPAGTPEFLWKLIGGLIQVEACTCSPDCGDSNCGDDGCGGQCGVCQPYAGCVEGTCVCLPDCAQVASDLANPQSEADLEKVATCLLELYDHLYFNYQDEFEAAFHSLKKAFNKWQAFYDVPQGLGLCGATVFGPGLAAPPNMPNNLVYQEVETFFGQYHLW